MKTAIKTIFTIILFFVGLNISQAATNYIDLESDIINAQVYLKKDGIEQILNIIPIKNYEKNTPLYNISLTNNFTKGYYDVYNYFWILDLNEKDYQNISTIIYFGYGYQDRTDSKWYDITQYLIFEYLAGETSEISFIDSNQNFIEPYNEEINMIKKDIANMYLMPSFIAENNEPLATLKINEKLTLEDQNNILNELTIPYVHSANINTSGNKITASFSEPGLHSIPLTKEFKANEEAKIYKKGDTLLFSRGSLNPYTKYIYLNILYPSLDINIKDEYGNTINDKTQVNIYYAPGELYGEYETSNGKIHLDEIYKGDFFLKEINTPYGYLPTKQINFKIESDDLKLDIINKTITKKVTIIKKSEVNKISVLEITDLKNQKSYFLKTNNKGLGIINLPYGKYVIHDTNPEKGYITPDLNFEINENYDENTSIAISSSKIIGTVNINLLDANTQELLKKRASFKIKNVTDGTYLNSGSHYQVDNGQIVLNNLSYGTYIIETIDIDNYISLNNIYEFQISKNAEIIEVNILSKEQEENNKINIDTVDRIVISVPKTGSKRNLLTVIICSLILCLGIYICNYDKN